MQLNEWLQPLADTGIIYERLQKKILLHVLNGFDFHVI